MLESYILSLIEISLQQLNWVIEEMYRSKGVTDCDMTYVMAGSRKCQYSLNEICFFREQEGLMPLLDWMNVSYHNHASSNVLLDFAATFSLPAINQSGFWLFVNQSSTRISICLWKKTEGTYICILNLLVNSLSIVIYGIVAKQFKAMDLGLWLCDKMTSEEALLQNCYTQRVP